MERPIEIIARAFIVDNNRVLLCKCKSKDNYFFPGGHVEIGETIEEALVREIKEEIGEDIDSVKFIGLLENTFSDKKGVHQEINIIFETKLNCKDVNCCEDHLEFGWFEIAKISEMNVLPETMKNEFLKWVKNKGTFYGR